MVTYHNTEVLIFYADKIMVMGNSKICMYLISRFYSNHENRENLMLAKYTCFTLSKKADTWCLKTSQYLPQTASSIYIRCMSVYKWNKTVSTFHSQRPATASDLAGSSLRHDTYEMHVISIILCQTQQCQAMQWLEHEYDDWGATIVSNSSLAI